MGLCYVQAVSRFDSESKSCPTVHAGIPMDSRRAETPSAGLSSTLRRNKMSEIKYEIIKKIGVLSKSGAIWAVR